MGLCVIYFVSKKDQYPSGTGVEIKKKIIFRTNVDSRYLKISRIRHNSPFTTQKLPITIHHSQLTTHQ